MRSSFYSRITLRPSVSGVKEVAAMTLMLASDEMTYMMEIEADIDRRRGAARNLHL